MDEKTDIKVEPALVEETASTSFAFVGVKDELLVEKYTDGHPAPFSKEENVEKPLDSYHSCSTVPKTGSELMCSLPADTGQRPFHNDHKATDSGQATIQNSRTPSGKRRHLCATCGKKFNSRPNLTEHMLIHTAEPSFSCIECGRKFSQKSVLKKHILTHSEDRPHSCCRCSKAFSRKDTLRKHMLVHSGERPFVCNECGLAFSFKYNLKSHTLTHRLERTHKCNICGTTFHWKSNFTRHMLKHSKE